MQLVADASRQSFSKWSANGLPGASAGSASFGPVVMPVPQSHVWIVGESSWLGPGTGSGGFWPVEDKDSRESAPNFLFSGKARSHFQPAIVIDPALVNKDPGNASARRLLSRGRRPDV
jgi:hypothetical protein